MTRPPNANNIPEMAAMAAVTMEPQPGEELQRWHQLPHESSEAYEAFFFFRSLYPLSERNINRAYHVMLSVRNPDRLAEISPRQHAPARWKSWYEEFEWETRANAWDEYVRNLLLDTEFQDLEGMVHRHRETLLKLHDSGMKYLDKFGHQSAATALRSVLSAMEMEQKLAGLPDVSHILVMKDSELQNTYKDLLAQVINSPED
jgi:hypothetical protein